MPVTSIPNRKVRRGFLLMAVVGILAVLLTLCVGFLSFARGEVMAVATLRDKNDAMDLYESSKDYMLAAIANDLFGGGQTNFDPSKRVAQAKGGAYWWYRPYMKGLGAAMQGWWGTGAQEPYFDVNTENDWLYFPADFFPAQVYGRFQCQVLDPNAFINVNDWLEDCSPTQCMMAHMFMDAYGDTPLERWRQGRDYGTAAGGWNSSYNVAPMRYEEAWRPASRTVRPMNWPNHYNERGVDNLAGDYWLTTNTVWMGLTAVDLLGVKPLIQTAGFPQKCNNARIPAATVFTDTYFMSPDVVNAQRGLNFSAIPGWGPKAYDTGGLGWTVSGFSTQAYCDPDTGRCPVNVNTCYNSGTILPLDTYTRGAVRPAYTMEGVFNVESLRRIVDLGVFYVDHDNDNNAVTPAERLTGRGLFGDPDYIVTKAAGWTDDQKYRAWNKHEELRTKMAYRYQEALCRYFTASYDHSDSRRWNFGNGGKSNLAALAPYSSLPGAAGVSNACAVTDYSAPRFNVPLAAFRSNVAADLTSMSTGISYVDFDAAETPTVALGRLDSRTADAVYDNIIPGKATISGAYPLQELYDWGLARQEDIDDPYNAHGYYNDKPHPMISYGGSSHQDHLGSNMSIRRKGHDIALNANGYVGPADCIDAADAHLPAVQNTLLPEDGKLEIWLDRETNNTTIPYRQRICSPDCFSTELTTTSTTFMLVLTVELLDKDTVATNPADPTKHKSIMWNQWGVVVELAPDVEGAAANNTHYYGTAKPAYYKTRGPADADGMDINTPFLRTRNRGGGGTGSDFERSPIYTRLEEFVADIRHIKPAQAAAFYPAMQNKRRVIIRSIFSGNANMSR